MGIIEELRDRKVMRVDPKLEVVRAIPEFESLIADADQAMRR